MIIRGELTCMPLRPHTDKEQSALPYDILTSDIDWCPTCVDCEWQLDNEEQFEAQSSFPNGPDSKLFNDYGKHRNIFDYHELHFFDTETFKEDILDDVIGSFLSCKKISTKRKDPEYNFILTPF